LPRHYGSNRLVLMVIDPGLVFAYWEFCTELLDQARAPRVHRGHDPERGNLEQAQVAQGVLGQACPQGIMAAGAHEIVRALRGGAAADPDVLLEPDLDVRSPEGLHTGHAQAQNEEQAQPARATPLSRPAARRHRTLRHARHLTRLSDSL
jgi:hypothetical protein